MSGTLVLIRNVGFKGPHKIADKWNQEVYVVVGRPDDNIPVYRVKSESQPHNIRTLHRNMILPIGGIALLASPQVPADKGPRPDIKSQREPTLKLSAQPHPDPSEEDLTSDHEEQEVFIVRPKGGN